MALRTVHTHCFDAFDFTPRLQMKAPTKNAGKSTAMALLKDVVPRALETENISQAFVYRAIELARLSVLMDEADTFLRGETRRQAGRCFGDNENPRFCPTFRARPSAAAPGYASSVAYRRRRGCSSRRRLLPPDQPGEARWTKSKTRLAQIRRIQRRTRLRCARKRPSG
jgi:hypothetical protein